MTTDPATPGALPSDIPVPTMQTAAEMYNGILTRFMDIQALKQQGKPVLWSTILLPKEILYAMDVPVMYQEVIGAVGSIMKLSGNYCQRAEDLGLSRDVCAIHRSALGCAATEEKDPFSQMLFAKPDIVMGSNFPCMSESKSFLFIADNFNCPHHFIDAPIDTWGLDIPDYAVKYYVEELQRAIQFLEEHGYKMDWDRLREEVLFTQRLNVLLEEIETYRKAVPCPMRAFDSFIAAVAPIALPKSMRGLGIFERLRAELKDMVDRGIGTIENERLRLLWVGVPPICNFELLNYPEKYGAVFAKNMLEYIVGVPLDPELLNPNKPLDSLARGMISNPLNPPYKLGIDYLVKTTKEYKIDGVVSVVKRSCGLIPGMQRLVKEAIYEETGVPSIVFDLDGVDTREYDDVSSKASIDSFIETLLARKEG